MNSLVSALQRSDRRRRVLAALITALLAGCGGGGGGSGGGGGGGGSADLVAPESEPNDTPAGATALLVGQPGSGALDISGDVDWWRIELARGQLLQLEVFASRTDQPTWDAPPVSAIPRVDVFHPDAQTIWRTHDWFAGAGASGAGFRHRPQDLDVSFLRVPVDGTYYVRLRPMTTATLGGAYVLRFRKAAFGPVALEQENLGAIGINDTPATAQPIQPGALFGAQSPGDVDVYSFQVSAPSLVSFELHAERGGMLGGVGAYLDMGLRLLGPNGSTELACSDNVHFADPRLEHSLQTPGTYYLEVAQARGATSGEYMLLHGVQPRGSVLTESEPNDTPGQAQSLALGVWLNGAVGPGDEDYHAFSVTAGDMLEVRLFDGSNADDRGGRAVAGLLRPDGVTALQGGGGWSGHRLTAICPESGVHFLHVTHDDAPTTYRVLVRVVRGAAFESEPNDHPAQAPALGVGERVAGRIDAPLDVDFVRIDAEAGKLVVLQCYAGWAVNGGSGERGSWGSTMAPRLVLYDDSPQLTELAVSSADILFCSAEGVAEFEPAIALAFIPPVTGTYYLAIEDAFERSSIDHLYVVERR